MDCEGSVSIVSRARCSQGVRGLDLRPLTEADTCCGFGGLFAVKMGEHLHRRCCSASSGTSKRPAPSCSWPATSAVLAHIGGGLHRRGSRIEVRHIAEVLASGRPTTCDVS